jgi:hypothetical protein
MLASQIPGVEARLEKANGALLRSETIGQATGS